MDPLIIEGDILDQDVQVIVNAWNRNIIPWWLLLPQGVSGAIKKRGGTAPFKELAKKGPIPLGQAVITGPGKLPFQAIIHVAGINMFWMATKRSIQDSVRSAMNLVHRHDYKSVAFPLIGSGSGNRGKEVALTYMLEAFVQIESDARVVIVKYKPIG
jgi:O-acetyl-ADP-ribose deacetylase